MSEDLQSSESNGGNKFFKVIKGIIAVFLIFTVSTLIIALSDPSIKPIVLLVTAIASIFAFKLIMK